MKMKRIKRYIWARFIGYNHDMTMRIFRCRVEYADGTEGLIEEERDMPRVEWDGFDSGLEDNDE
jgi:hypothetical protein